MFASFVSVIRKYFKVDDDDIKRLNILQESIL